MTNTMLLLTGVPSPEMVACAMVTLAALGLAWLGMRRSVSSGEHARALELQLSAEREARCQADQALAANHDVMCRLVCETQDARGAASGDGLCHALERCVAEHAHLNGLRYRFEAGVDPAARSHQGRAARLAVLRVLQEVLAAGHPGGCGGEVSVRLSEGAGVLGLEIGGCAGAGPLPADIHDQLQVLGAVLRVVDNGLEGGQDVRRERWSLSVPVQETADVA